MSEKEFSGGYIGNNPVYVGIDPSLTGFACTALSANGYHTNVYTSPLKGVDRLNDIAKWYEDWMNRWVALDVAMEGTVRLSASASVLGELSGIVKLVTYRRCGEPGKHPLQVAPASLKKYVTGNGSTKVAKSQMLLATYKKWGITFTDDNAADSYGIAHMLSGQGSLAYERDVYDKIVTNGIKYRS